MEKGGAVEGCISGGVVSGEGDHRVHIFTREEKRVSVSAHSAGEYTATLLVMVNVIKGGGRAPPTLTSLGYFYHHDGMYARKQRLLLCTL